MPVLAHQNAPSTRQKSSSALRVSALVLPPTSSLFLLLRANLHSADRFYYNGPPRTHFLSAPPIGATRSLGSNSFPNSLRLKDVSHLHPEVTGFSPIRCELSSSKEEMPAVFCRQTPVAGMPPNGFHGLRRVPAPMPRKAASPQKSEIRG